MNEPEHTQALIDQINKKFDLLGLPEKDKRGHFSPLGRLEKYITRTAARFQQYRRFISYSGLVVIEEIPEPGRSEFREFIKGKTIFSTHGKDTAFASDFTYFLLTWPGMIESVS